MGNNSNTCPGCGSKNIVRDFNHGEVYCADCGMVIEEEFIDPGQEWRAYNAEQIAKRIRTGPPSSYRIHDKGLGTKPTSAGGKVRTKRVVGGYNKGERNLAFALGEIERMASVLELPDDVRERAGALYREAMEQKLIKGRSIEELVSGMIHIVCKEYNIPRTLNEMTGASRSTRKKIRRSYFFLARNLGIEVRPSSPVLYLPRFCSELNLSGATRECAIAMLTKDHGRMLSKGRAPVGIAAAAIYEASKVCGEWRTEKEIAKVTGMTEITIRNRSKELVENVSGNVDLSR